MSLFLSATEGKPNYQIHCKPTKSWKNIRIAQQQIEYDAEADFSEALCNITIEARIMNVII